MRPVLVVGLLFTGVISGCASGGSPAPSPSPVAHAPAVPAVACPPALSTAFAQGGTVTEQSDVSPGLSTCNYRTEGAKAGTCSAASVSINNNPQAFKDFQRWVVETAQNDTTAGLGNGQFPQEVDGVGVEASWVPATLNFETATATRWVAIRLTCASSGPQNLALAKELGRAALAA